MLKDKDLNVRLAGAKAFWHVTKNADVAIPVLVDLLDEERLAAFEEGEAQRRFVQSVIESLGRIGPPAKAAVERYRQDQGQEPVDQRIRAHGSSRRLRRRRR